MQLIDGIIVWKKRGDFVSSIALKHSKNRHFLLNFFIYLWKELHIWNCIRCSAYHSYNCNTNIGESMEMEIKFGEENLSRNRRVNERCNIDLKQMNLYMSAKWHLCLKYWFDVHFDVILKTFGSGKSNFTNRCGYWKRSLILKHLFHENC